MICHAAALIIALFYGTAFKECASFTFRLQHKQADFKKTLALAGSLFLSLQTLQQDDKKQPFLFNKI